MSDRELLQQMIARIGREPRAVKFDEDDNLVDLNLAGLDLEELPEEVVALTHLLALRLGEDLVSEDGRRLIRLGNKLTCMPPELTQSVSLHTLVMSYNQLSSVPPEVGQLINLRTLDLSGNQLTSLPSELGQLTNLQELRLIRNRLISLPSELGQLTNLRTLWVSLNQLTGLLPEVGRLSNLQQISLAGNQLATLPPELGKLTNLEFLGLSDNQLTEVSFKVGHLVRLHQLSMSDNRLASLPPELGKLVNLRFLFVDGNQLTSLPPELGQLANLETLALSRNQLTSLPPELGQLVQLGYLWLHRNQLTTVPRSFAGLVNLAGLDLNDNPLRTPPPEIARQGAAAVRTYLARLDDTSAIRHEAKLLLVGEGGTGKSSLLRALRGQEFDPHLITTHGVDVLPITLPCPGRDCIDLTLNVWDFGGQQIYHTTHQFFMTRRSLYLLVWNARGDVDQGRLDHWLRKIQVLAPGSPVLLVATHSDERPADINLERFRAAYPQIVGLATVSNKTGAGIEALKATIAAEAAKLPLMEQEWPHAWVDVEAALMATNKPHISGQEFAAVCAGYGVDDPFEQGVLGGYLHDLGKILYYQDDDVLCDFVVLKPDWLTGAMARVLDDAVTRDQRHGVLDHADFPRIWRGYDRRLYPVFTRMLERFLISYQLEEIAPGHRQSMIPLLLPHSPPAALPPWSEILPDQPEVRMVFDLDFVPDGIMSWFIVLTHHYSQDLHWREGVRLQYDGHQAHVELNPSTRQLWLYVRGSAPSNFFNILQHTINDRIIRRYFEGLNYRRRVPCICHKARGETTPCTHYFDYDKVVERKQAGKPTIECGERPYADVSVSELLEGIHYTTLDRLDARVERILEIVGENRELLQQVHQLSEQSLREQTRMWNLLTQSLFSDAPSLFVLMPGDRRSFDPRELFSEGYQIYLLCQHPAGPHMVEGEKGYPAPQDREWWRQVRPWLHRLTKLLKFVPELSGAAKAYDEQWYKSIELSMEVYSAAAEALPAFDPRPEQLTRRELVGAMGANIEPEGAALRALHTYLRQADKTQHWCGLQKVVTNDGNILWLCAEHARFHGV